MTRLDGKELSRAWAMEGPHHRNGNFSHFTTGKKPRSFPPWGRGINAQKCGMIDPGPVGVQLEAALAGGVCSEKGLSARAWFQMKESMEMGRKEAPGKGAAHGSPVPPWSGRLISLAGSSWIHAALIAVAVAAAYSNTLRVPFLWDEPHFLVHNPFVRDIYYFVCPWDARELKAGNGFLYSFFVLRYVGFLSFALNYGVNGFSVAGYHAVNIALHMANAILLYALAVLTLRTPLFADGSPLARNPRPAALVCSLLFAVHPLHTMAVTYIFQRFVPLATFFFLVSLDAYAASRMSADRERKAWLYGTSVASAILAMKTKEIAFTLPVIICLYECLFFTDTPKRRALLLAPLALTMTIIPASVAYLMYTMGTGADALPGYVSPVYSRWQYMLTEFRVVVTYLRLLLVPVGQNVDHDYLVSASFLNLQVLPAFCFLAAFFLLGVYLAVGGKWPGGRKTPFPVDARLAGFGILWFFITLSVESSVVPLSRLVDEYRPYLPSAGAVIAAVAGVSLALRKAPPAAAKRIGVVLPVLLASLLGVAAHERNAVWKNGISLWEDAERKSPMKASVHTNLGWAYHEQGMFDKAIAEYRTAIRLDPGASLPHVDLGAIYLTKGMLGEAVAEDLAAIKTDPVAAEPRNNLGFAYQTLGMFDKAVEEYTAAERMNPNYAEPHFNLGYLWYRMGETEKARRETIAGLEIKPYDEQARRLLDQITAKR